MQQKKYEVLNGHTVQDIEDKINNLYNRGYKIKGPLQINQYGYFQVMKLKKTNNE